MTSAPIAGHSLLELLMTIAVAAVVFSLGMPSLAGLGADKRLRAESDALFRAVHLARKSSIVRRRVVTICASSDAETCRADGDWSAGWILYEEQGSSGAGQRDSGETILQFRSIGPDVHVAANRRSFSFRSTHTRATNGTLRICDSRGRARSRALVISYTGRPRVAVDEGHGLPPGCAPD